MREVEMLLATYCDDPVVKPGILWLNPFGQLICSTFSCMTRVLEHSQTLHCAMLCAFFDVICMYLIGVFTNLFSNAFHTFMTQQKKNQIWIVHSLIKYLCLDLVLPVSQINFLASFLLLHSQRQLDFYQTLVAVVDK